MLRFSTRQEKEVSVISLSMCIFIKWFQNLIFFPKIRLADIKLSVIEHYRNLLHTISDQEKNVLLVCDSKYHMLHQKHLSFYNRKRSYGETTALYRYTAGDLD